MNRQATAVKLQSEQRARRRQLFAAFNSARKLAREGAIDEGRLNRALGVAQTTAADSHIARYSTTPGDCECPDRVYRGRKTGQPCKGMLALALNFAAEVA